MPTLRTVTVKSSGGDYSSLSAAEAGEQGDLPSLDRQLDIECYAMNDTTAVTFNGWTTDATRYIRVFTPSTERHAGVWNTGKYRLVVSASFGSTLYINEDFVRVEGLQVDNTNADGAAAVRVDLTAAAASSDIRVETCILRATSPFPGTLYIGSGKTTARNCVITAGAQAACYGIFNTNGPTFNLDNCTVIGATHGVQNGGATTINATNVYAHGGTDAYTGTVTRTTCAHSSATSFSGSTASIAHDTSNFTNVTGGSEDYHLVSGASATLKTGGTDLSGTFTTDIDGETRSDWSIGADEIVAAPGGLSIPIAAYHYNHHLAG